ncbi:MAG TPA: pitrilysin family protein [Acidobacteriota bacterium]
MRGRSAALLLLAVFWSRAALHSEAWLGRERVQRIALPNGLVLIYQKDSSSTITSLDILIKGGKRAEPGGMSGLAYLTTRLLLEIQDSRSAQQLMIQASPMALTGQADYSLISIDSLSEHLDETLRIVSRSLQWPLFTGIRIDAVKKNMETQRDRESEEALAQSRAFQLQAFFGPTGYGASSYGTAETIKAIKSRDISRFYEAHFQAPEIILSAVSDLEAEEIKTLLMKHLKEIRRRQPVELSPAPQPLSPPAHKEFRAEKDMLQSLVSAGYSLPGATDRLFVLATLTESLLGKGVASRLWRLRQDEKLAYDVNCHYTPMKESSLLEAYLETENRKKDTALTALRQTLGEVWQKGVGADELEAAKKIALTDLLRANEAKSKRALNLAVYEALGLGFDFLEKIPALFEAVTVAEMNSFLSSNLDPERAVWVVIAGTKEKSSPRPSRP